MWESMYQVCDMGGEKKVNARIYKTLGKLYIYRATPQSRSERGRNGVPRRVQYAVEDDKFLLRGNAARLIKRRVTGLEMSAAFETSNENRRRMLINTEHANLINKRR